MTMAIERDISFFVFDEWSLKAADELSRLAGKAARVHLKVDTGLGRLGFLPDQAPAVRELLSQLKHLSIEGLASHVAAPVKASDDWFTQVQYDRFTDVCKVIDPDHKLLRHFASSNTLPRLRNINADGVRPQCVLWGLAHAWPLPWPLKTVVTFKSRIVQVKELPVDHFVGYSFAYKTTRPTRLAVVPIGVGDGLKPDHKNGGHVLVGGRRCPIIGVCSCEMMVDVTTVPGAQPEDEVVLIGTQGNETQDAVTFGIEGRSSFMSTLPLISPRIPRLYWENGKCIRREAYFREI
jgi:alanine racemase